MATQVADYDTGYRQGVFDKCNGKEARYDRSFIETDIDVGGYFDAFDACDVRISQASPLARIVRTDGIAR